MQVRLQGHDTKHKTTQNTCSAIMMTMSQKMFFGILWLTLSNLVVKVEFEVLSNNL